MNKYILIGSAVLFAVVAVVIFATRPEPTPQEQLMEAAEQAGEAMRDATEAAGQATQEASDAVRQEIRRTAEEVEASLAETATNMMQSISEVSQETSESLLALIGEWRASGIVTSEGIDYDAAVAAVESSDMDFSMKARFISLLEDLRDAPDRAVAKLEELETALTQ
ncbi:MAG: hypothetical protein AAGA38_03035 [Pseudomonadota bacterium]